MKNDSMKIVTNFNFISYNSFGLNRLKKTIIISPTFHRRKSMGVFETTGAASGTPFGPVGGGVGRLPPPRTGLPPPRIGLPPPPPHSPVWVFSFEKLSKSAIYVIYI